MIKFFKFYLLFFNCLLIKNFNQVSKNEFFGIGTKLAVNDIIQNGVTYVFYNNDITQRSKLQKISPVEIVSRYFYTNSKQFKLVKIISIIEKQHALNVTIHVDIQNQQIFIRYKCKSKEDIIVTFTAHYQSIYQEKKEFQMKFSLLKYCGNFKMLDFQSIKNLFFQKLIRLVGLAKIPNKQKSSSEVVKFGKLSSNFMENENLFLVSGNTEQSKFYFSYQPDWEQYSKILSYSKERLIEQSIAPQLKELFFSQIRIYSDNLQLLNPYFLINGNQPQSSISFLQIDFDQQFNYKDNLKEISQTLYNSEFEKQSQPILYELVKQLNLKQVQNFSSTSGQKNLQNGLLNQLSQIELNLQQELIKQIEINKQKIRRKEINDYSKAQKTYALFLKKHEKYKENLEAKNQLLQQQNEVIKQFLQKEQKTEGVSKQTIALIKNIEQILNQENQQGIKKSIEYLQEKDLKGITVFDESNSDVTTKSVWNFYSQNSFLQLMQNNIIELSIIFNCSGQGQSNVFLEFIPTEVFNPFDPIVIQWTKICKIKKPCQNIKLNFVDLLDSNRNILPHDSQIIYQKGLIMKQYSLFKKIENIQKIQYFQSNITLIISLTSHNQNPISILPLQVISSHPNIAGIAIENLQQSFQDENIIIKYKQPLQYRLNFQCKQYGKSNFKIKLILLGPYNQIDLKFVKICTIEKLQINIYSSKYKGIFNQSKPLSDSNIKGDIIRDDQFINKDPYTILQQNQEYFLLVSQTTLNQQPFPVTFYTFANEFGKIYVFPQKILYNYHQGVSSFQVEFDCFTKDQLVIGTIIISIQNYKNISFPIQTFCKKQIFSITAQILRRQNILKNVIYYSGICILIVIGFSLIYLALQYVFLKIILIFLNNE